MNKENLENKVCLKYPSFFPAPPFTNVDWPHSLRVITFFDAYELHELNSKCSWAAVIVRLTRQGFSIFDSLRLASEHRKLKRHRVSLSRFRKCPTCYPMTFLIIHRLERLPSECSFTTL